MPPVVVAVQFVVTIIHIDRELRAKLWRPGDGETLGQVCLFQDSEPGRDVTETSVK
jgi:hypothetical protein